MNYEELNIYTDGGARGNPGPAAAGIVIMTTKSQIVDQFGKYLGETTNNQAEYQAVILALQRLKKFRPRRLNLFLDSELIVRQLTGHYKVKNVDLKPHFDDIVAELAKYKVTIQHVYRADNKLADKQVNLAIDQALGLK